MSTSDEYIQLLKFCGTTDGEIRQLIKKADLEGLRWAGRELRLPACMCGNLYGHTIVLDATIGKPQIVGVETKTVMLD